MGSDREQHQTGTMAGVRVAPCPAHGCRSFVGHNAPPAGSPTTTAPAASTARVSRTRSGSGQMRQILPSVVMTAATVTGDAGRGTRVILQVGKRVVQWEL